MGSRHARAGRPVAAPPVRSNAGHVDGFASSLAAHRRGDLEAAREGYTRILERHPDHFDALHLLGVVAVQLGQPDVAETLIGLALEIRPKSHEALGNLALAHKALGRNDAAEHALRSAITIAPEFVDGLRNLSGLLQARGESSEAIALLQRAARLSPANASVRGNLGALLLGQGQAQAAWPHLARAVELAPNDATNWANLARAALDLDRIAEGVNAGERALALVPVHVSALVSMSALERVRGRFDAAERYAQRALQLSPADRGARLNLGTALAEMSRYDDAIRIFDEIVAIDPRDVEARVSRAANALAAGRPELAWDDHAWRWRLLQSAVPCVPAMREWRGESLKDATLYVWPEQGIGDEIVFASTLPEAASRVRRLVLGCDPRLVPVFARSFPMIHVVTGDDLAGMTLESDAMDRQCSIVDLAAWLRPTLQSFPRRRGDLVPDDQRVVGWRQWLGSLGPGLAVGISWRSQNLRGERRLACSELAQWGPIFEVPGIHFICLQYDECESERVAAQKRFGVAIHRPPCLDQRNDIDGVIALMAGLDLVLTAPTTVSTLSGGVGTTTWQLTRGIDWHAMGCTHSPWQPSVRQVYRSWNVDWAEFFVDVGAELRRFADSASSHDP